MSVDSKINEIESARNIIRSKMVDAGQASSSDKLEDLANNLTFEKYYATDDTAETTIADDDYFPFYDTSATGKRKSLWSNIKAKLKTYFDTLYPSVGGHTIEDPEGTALTQRDTLQFGGDLEVSDDDENEKTVVAPHELTAAELAEIVTPLPSVPVNMPILFDETGTERVVGWYKYANGTKKPVYEKTIIFQGTTYDLTSLNFDYLSVKNFVVTLSSANVRLFDSEYYSSNDWVRLVLGEKALLVQKGSSGAIGNVIAIIQYTKTTDTPT